MPVYSQLTVTKFETFETSERPLIWTNTVQMASLYQPASLDPEPLTHLNPDPDPDSKPCIMDTVDTGQPTDAKQSYICSIPTLKGQCHEIFCIWFFS